MRLLNNGLFFLSVACMALSSSSTYAQQKVANFAYGEPNTAEYEHFSFWTNNGNRTRISYTYGLERKELTLRYVSKTILDGNKAFMVVFPNKLLLTVIPATKIIKVVDTKRTYNKIFNWEYEGPVDGRGTWCEVCTQDEAESIELLKKAYLK